MGGEKREVGRARGGRILEAVVRDLEGKDRSRRDSSEWS